MPGYSREIFDVKIEDKYLCSSCRLVLREPCQTYCGHRYCKSCLDEIYRLPGLQMCRQCPQDEQSDDSLLKSDQAFPDRAIKRETGELPVKCQNSLCAWEGKVHQYDAHEEVCEFGLIQCPIQGCDKQVMRMDLAAHLKKECAITQVKCKFCAHEMLRKNEKLEYIIETLNDQISKLLVQLVQEFTIQKQNVEGPGMQQVVTKMERNMKAQFERIVALENMIQACIQSQELAKAGFFYTGSNDCVQCFFRQGILRNWEAGDRAMNEHSRHFSSCPFILNFNVGNIPVPFPPDTGLEGKQAPRLGQQGDQASVHPQMAEEQARLKSFQVWPHVCDPPHLARAGFFYAGGDKVKCYYCGGGLRDWDPGDDPWKEHAKRFPRCEFLLQQRGEDFVREVQAGFIGHGFRTKQQPLRYTWADQLMEVHLDHVSSWSSNLNSVRNIPIKDTGQQRGKQSPVHSIMAEEQTKLKSFHQVWPHLFDLPGTHRSDLPHLARAVFSYAGPTLDAEMQSRVVRGVLEMGFNPWIVREAVQQQLRDHGNGFSSVHELVVAVLDVEEEEERMEHSGTSQMGNRGSGPQPLWEHGSGFSPALEGEEWMEISGASRMGKEHGSDTTTGDASSFEDRLRLNDRLRELYADRMLKIPAVFISCGHLVVSVGNYSFDCTMQMWGTIKCTDVTMAGIGS